MKLETDKISGSQFMFSIACFIQSSMLLTSFFVPLARQASWVCVLSGIIVTIPLLLIFLKLMQDYPDKNLIQIYRVVFGPVLGPVISLLTVLYFITLTTYNVRDIGFLVKQTIMTETPVLIIVVVSMLVCAYGVYHGLRVVSRYSMVFTFVATGLVVLASLLTLNLWKFENFLPVFDGPALRYVQSAHILVNIPLGEIVMLLMVAPNIKRSKKGLFRYLLGGILIGGVVLLFVVIRDTAVLGNIITLFSMPPYETLRLINVTQVLNRIEIIFGLLLIVLLFFKIMVMFYCTVMATAQTFGMQSYKPIVLIIGALVVTYAFFLHSSIMEHAEFGRSSAPAIWTLFEYIIPLSALIVGRIRGLPKKSLQEGVV